MLLLFISNVPPRGRPEVPWVSQHHPAFKNALFRDKIYSVKIGQLQTQIGQFMSFSMRHL